MTNTLKVISCAAVAVAVLAGCSGGPTNDAPAKDSASKATKGPMADFTKGQTDNSGE